MILSRFPDKSKFLKLAESYDVVPVCVQILADTHTPVSLFGRFYEDKGPIFFLESAEGGERWGRYSFHGRLRAPTHGLRDRNDVVVRQGHRREAHPAPGRSAGRPARRS